MKYYKKHNDLKFYNLAVAYANTYANLANRKHKGERARAMLMGKARKLAAAMRSPGEYFESLMKEFRDEVEILLGKRERYI